MEKFKFENDIYILKHETYIKKHPDNPLAYLKLGNLYLKNSFYKKAKSSFLKSYNCDNRYLVSIIGAAICDVNVGKYSRAIKLIDKHKKVILNNTLLKYKLTREVSNIYHDIKIGKHPNLSRKFKRINSPFNKKLIHLNMDNPLFINFLCIVKSLKKYPSIPTKKDLEIFYRCIYEKGLTPDFRYLLMSIISVADKNIRLDKNLAILFHDISDNMDIDYVNFVFKTVLDSFDFHHIKRVYRSINNIGKPISNQNLWKFVHMSKKYACMDISTTNSCIRLLKNGWVDKTVINTLRKIDEKHLNKYKLFI